MLKSLLRDTKFLYKVRNFYKENKKEILDIVLFGSVVRGKEKPKDIDLLILYKNKENLELSYSLKNSLAGMYNVQVVSKTYSSLLSDLFKAKEAFLMEGYSLIKKKFIAECFGFFSGIIFKYDLTGKSKSERMRFYYILYGRDKKDKGLLEKYSIIKFSNSILLSSITESENIRDFLNTLGIKYKEFSVLIPSRLKNVLY